MFLLDNTVLSNFALINRLDLLPIALEGEVVTPTQVIREFKSGIEKGLFSPANYDWLIIVELTSQERALFNRYLSRVNAGEAACLAVAGERNGRILTDDRDARKLAARLRIPVSGTIGVLIRLYDLGILTLSEANQLLKQMIERGYRSPIDKLEDL